MKYRCFMLFSMVPKYRRPTFTYQLQIEGLQTCCPRVRIYRWWRLGAWLFGVTESKCATPWNYGCWVRNFFYQYRVQVRIILQLRSSGIRLCRVHVQHKPTLERCLRKLTSTIRCCIELCYRMTPVTQENCSSGGTALWEYWSFV